MLELPDVTLVCVSGARCANLSAMAVDDCRRQIRFGAEHVVLDAEINSIEDYSLYLWREVPPKLTTSHFLVVQWDGWVIDAGAWRRGWLQYDYIGAPWGFDEAVNVGNGGFSLRSKRLADRLAGSSLWLLDGDEREDVVICRIHRPQLEAEGFRWAPEAEARVFSFECQAPEKRHFGFHAMRNWPFVLSRQRLAERFAVPGDYALGDREQVEHMIRNIQGMAWRGKDCGYLSSDAAR